MRFKWLRTLLSRFCSPARVVAFHAAQRPWPRPRPPSPLSISWQPFPALFCWERSNTFCRHCCPVMGKNFCDWNSQVTWLKVCFLFWFFLFFILAAHRWHWIRRPQLEAKTLKIVFFSVFFCHFSQDCLYLLLFLLNSPWLSSFSSDDAAPAAAALEELFALAKCYFNAWATFLS